jgi:low temperature requirement protein LtrA
VPDGEHQVTPLELFFDLVFVFAVTQVTTLLTNDPTWHGVLRGALVLSAVWWAWTGYAWLTSTLDVDEGGVRLAMLAAMAAMLGVALAVPGAFGDDALLFAVSFLVVRILHVALYASVAWNDRDLLRAMLRLAPSELVAATFLLVAVAARGELRIALWLAALAIDYLGPVVARMHGWHIAPMHFAERHGLVVLIALGESVIAIGVGAGVGLGVGVLLAALLGAVVISALWWLYFDVAALLMRQRLRALHGVEQVRLARDAYSYLHLPLVAGVVYFAFGLETTLHHVHDELKWEATAALGGGLVLYLLGQVALLHRGTGRIFRRRSLACVALLALVPLGRAIPAIATLGIASAVCVFVIAYEAITHLEHRRTVRSARAG